MKNAYLIPNTRKDADYALARSIASILLRAGGGVFVPLGKGGAFAGLPVTEAPSAEDADYVIALGGDGAFIDASHLALACDIPIIGVNLGRLGYLPELEKADLELFGNIPAGNYRTEERTVLEVTCKSETAYAINEVSLTDTALADIRLTRADREIFTYRANGLVVATASGSTAYSFSAGGPVIDRTLDTICVTPICPHSLFDRSVVFRGDEKLTIGNACAEKPLVLAADGKTVATLQPGDTADVRAGARRLTVLSLKDRDFLERFREKIRLTD